MANDIGSYAVTSGSLAQSLINGLRQSGEEEAAAGAVSNQLENIEDQLLKELSKPEKAQNGVAGRDEGKIEVLQVKYKRAMRMYEALQTVLRNAHEIMMRAIQNMRVS